MVCVKIAVIGGGAAGAKIVFLNRGLNS